MEKHNLALVLSGGNALGAYQAGCYEALNQSQMEPDLVAGASAGAINGAIICGNPIERRLAGLEALWKVSSDASPAHSNAFWDEARRTSAAAWTLATGHPGMFVPRHLFGPWWNPLGNGEPSSLYDASPLAATVEQLIDFDLLNKGSPRYAATAVDIETGDDLCFDTRIRQLTPDHLRASCALLPAFSPVEIAGRLLADAGISVNLPIDLVLGEDWDHPLLCIAIDLLPLGGARPGTLGETVSRMQDLLFATQSRRAIAAWQAIFDERIRAGSARSVTILYIAYQDQMREVSGKAFDFSRQSAAFRWQAGLADMTAALTALTRGEVEIGEPGLSLYNLNGDRKIEKAFWPVGPKPF